MATHAHSTPTAASGEPTRRRLMSALSGAAFAGTALVIAAPSAEAASPDAELLAVLAEHVALERQIFPEHGPATIEEEEIWEVAVEPLQIRKSACLNCLCEMETHTLEGFRARARTLLVWNAEFIGGLERDAAAGYVTERMLLALFRGLVGECPA